MRKGLLKFQTKLNVVLLAWSTLFPPIIHASFIESTIGTAVVNDATAAYYNPAALTLLKNPQIITLGSVAYLHTDFTGKVIQSATRFTQTGSSPSQSNYFLPSAYLGVPASRNVFVGLAVIANSFNRDFDDHSVLRYAQSNNETRDFDVVPAVGIKLNEFFSFGAGLSVSHVNLLLKPITGAPSLNIPDSQSRNESSATAWGGDVGLLLKPTQATLIGFNYRGAVTYRQRGTSTSQGRITVTSNQYRFNIWTPARSVLSINHSVSPTLSFIATAQFIQWSIFHDINIHGIATQIVGRPVIVNNATAHFHMHDAWVFTLGTHYRIKPEWVIRIAGSYLESPANPHYQISNGDNIILGASMSYAIFKGIIIDGSYAHAFIKNQTIHITSGRNIVSGINKAFRDVFTIKLTFNLH